MKILDIAINVLLAGAVVAISLNLPEDGYLKFVDVRPIAETQLAKVLDGDTQDCLTNPSQTKAVPMSQALSLEGKTARQAISELGNAFCQEKNNTLKYLTTSGKWLYVQINETLDEPIRYGFTKPEAASPAATTKTGRTNPRDPVPVSRESQSKGDPLEKR